MKTARKEIQIHLMLSPRDLSYEDGSPKCPVSERQLSEIETKFASCDQNMGKPLPYEANDMNNENKIGEIVSPYKLSAPKYQALAKFQARLDLNSITQQSQEAKNNIVNSNMNNYLYENHNNEEDSNSLLNSSSDILKESANESGNALEDIHIQNIICKFISPEEEGSGLNVSFSSMKDDMSIIEAMDKNKDENHTNHLRV